MPPAVPRPTAAARPAGARAASVWFAGARLWVRLAAGRGLGVPLERFRRLAGATAAARSRREPLDQGAGVRWPEPDDDVSVLALSGHPSCVQDPATGVRGVPLASRSSRGVAGPGSLRWT